jgi:hypothetical protein
MKTWQQKVGDTLALNTGSNPPPKIDLAGKERKTDQWQPEWIVKNISTQRSSAPLQSQNRCMSRRSISPLEPLINCACCASLTSSWARPPSLRLRSNVKR